MLSMAFEPVEILKGRESIEMGFIYEVIHG
jgi:hypothetical protein